MMEELAQVVSEIESHSEMAVVIFRGAGKAFSAGVDIAAHTPDKIEEMLRKFHGVIRALVATRKITIAAVRGCCLGGGAELAMVCDLVYSSDDAEWGYPEIKLGCFPPVACTALAALVGHKRAAEMILTGASINGREAAAIGLATRAASEQQLDSALQECVDNFYGSARRLWRLQRRRIIRGTRCTSTKAWLGPRRVYFEDLMKTADAQEGIVRSGEASAKVDGK